MEYKSISLKNIIEKIEKNEYILPNFQRGFVWDLDKQKKLIASFLVKIPIGSTLLLEGKRNDFSARPLCEINEIKFNDDFPCVYILDGQQRLSTLKNCFFNLYANNNWKLVLEKLFDKLRVRWFLKVDNEFFGYDKLKFNRGKLESTEPQKLLDYIIPKKISSKKDTDKWWHPENDKNYKEFRNKAAAENQIPLFEVFKEEGLHKKILQQIANKRVLDIKQDIENKKANIEDFLDVDEMDTPQDIEIKWNIYAADWANSVSNYLSSLLDSKIPYVELPSKEIGRAAAIFEEINKGGLALSTYDLLVAKTAKHMNGVLTDYILKSFEKDFDIKQFNSDFMWKPSCMLSGKANELSKKFQDIFLNAIAILIYGKIKGTIKSLKKEDLYQKEILEIDGQTIVDNLDEILKAIKRAYAFLQFKLGIVSEKNIRYVYMILPIIYLLSFDEIWNDSKKLDLLEAWYWSSFFSGEFRESQDDKFIKNLQMLYVLLEIDEYKELLKDKEENEISKQEKLKDWFNEEEKKYDFNKMLNRVLESEDYSDLNTLLNPNECPKAMEDAVLQYCLSKEPKDFRIENPLTLTAYYAACKSDETNQNEKCKKYKLEIHHIIPLGNNKKIGESTKELRKSKNHMLNSPLNLAYISECANREISDLNVEIYLEQLGDKITDNCLTTERNFYKKRDDEDENDFYKRLLEKRYEKIKETIKYEIRELTK